MALASECRKRRYPDRASAERALVLTRKKRKGGRAESHIYRCPYCNGFHLTSGRARKENP
jgi:hypothetical protein